MERAARMQQRTFGSRGLPGSGYASVTRPGMGVCRMTWPHSPRGRKIFRPGTASMPGRFSAASALSATPYPRPARRRIQHPLRLSDAPFRPPPAGPITRAMCAKKGCINYAATVKYVS